jgi:hypothetical protein
VRVDSHVFREALAAKVNVQTGRSKWHKRVDTTTKVVKKTRDLNDDVTLGEETVGKLHACATEKIIKKHKVSHQVSLASGSGAFATFGAIANSAAASSDAPTNNFGQGPLALQDGDTGMDASDDEDPDLGIDNLMSALESISGKPKKTKALPASSQGSKVKKIIGTAKTNPTANTKASKSKADARAPVVESDAVVAVQDMDDADQAIFAPYLAKMSSMQDELLADLPADESALTSSLKEKTSGVLQLRTSIAGKAKSLKRRTTDASGLRGNLDKLTAQLDVVVKFLKSLFASDLDEDLTAEVSSYQENGWVVSQSLVCRSLKAMVHADIRWSRWSDLFGTTKQTILNELGDNEGKTFFMRMLNEVTQKLLRAVPNAKASNCKMEQT